MDAGQWQVVLETGIVENDQKYRKNKIRAQVCFKILDFDIG